MVALPEAIDVCPEMEQMENIKSYIRVFHQYERVRYWKDN